jgi:hypothetical protein
MKAENESMSGKGREKRKRQDARRKGNKDIEYMSPLPST